MKERVPNLNDGIRGYIDGDADSREWTEENEREWRQHLQELDSGQIKKEYNPKLCNCGMHVCVCGGER